MPTTPRARRPTQAKAQAAEHAFATRVAQLVEPEGRDNGAGGPHVEHTPRASPATSRKSTDPSHRRTAEPSGAEGLASVMGESFARLAAALGQLQEQMRETAESLTDTRAAAARNVTALQQKVIENTQRNISDMINHAQKMMHVSDMSEAFKLQAGFAQDAFRTFVSQADELRALSVKLARDASEPISERINRSMKRFRSEPERS